MNFLTQHQEPQGIPPCGYLWLQAGFISICSLGIVPARKSKVLENSHTLTLRPKVLDSHLLELVTWSHYPEENWKVVFWKQSQQSKAEPYEQLPLPLSWPRSCSLAPGEQALSFLGV